MLQLETIFKNLFEGPRISDDNLKEFTEDHTQRLIANNNAGAFNPILSATQTCYTNYFGNISNEDTHSAVRKSLTLSADNLMETFKDTVSQKEGIIKGQYGVSSPTYLEFFPQGISEYRNAIKANIETLMNRMMNAATAHQTDLGNAFVQLFTDLHNNYVLARTSQLNKKGEVSTDKTNTKAARTALEIQLTKNIHFIGYLFPGNANHAMSFFDQNIIQHNHHHSGPPSATTNTNTN